MRKQIRKEQRRMQRESKEVADFYKSDAWEKTRKAYIISKYGMCERCTSPGVIVHHKTYITKQNIHDERITLSFDNLELLCRKCHNKEHFKDDYGCVFDNEGNPVAPPPI